MKGKVTLRIAGEDKEIEAIKVNSDKLEAEIERLNNVMHDLAVRVSDVIEARDTPKPLTLWQRIKNKVGGYAS